MFSGPEVVILFPEGGNSSTLCSSFTIIDDTELEGNHEFTVAIMDISSDPPHAIIDDASTATIVTITDDECKWNLKNPLVVYCCGINYVNELMV